MLNRSLAVLRIGTLVCEIAIVKRDTSELVRVIGVGR